MSTDSDTTEAAVGPVRVPRKSAPIKQFRRRKTAAVRRPDVEPPVVETDSTEVASVPDEPIVVEPPAGEPPVGEPPVEPPVIAATAATDSTEAAPERSGAALSYRERRRAAGSGATPTRVVKKRADRSRLGLALAGVVAGLLVIVLAVVSVMFTVGTDRIENRAAQRAEYSAFARQMIVNLTSLSPSTIDDVTQTFESKTSGKALEQLQQSLQQTTDLIKSQGVTTKGTILSDAVVDSDADSATVMLVSGWTMDTPAQPAAGGGSATPPAGGDTVVQTFRWKVTVTKINGEMKMTGVEWVT